MTRDVARRSWKAADWLVKLRSTEKDDATEQAFRDWLAENPSNELELERCEAVLGFTRMLADDGEFAEDLDGAHAYEPDATRVRRPLAAWGARVAASVVVVCGVLLAFILLNADEYETAIGEQRTIVLADQSTVTLNTDTRLSVALDNDRREVRLHQGQAYFEVAPEANRPFEVHAGRALIRALGTEFDVNIKNDHIRVAVLEGSVAIVSSTGEASNSAVLRAGESVTYWSSGLISMIEQGDTETAWRQGEIDLNGATLAEAIEEHNRYTTRKIVIGSSSIANLRVSGVVKVRDTESLIFLLEKTLDIYAIENSDSITLVAIE